MIQKLSRATLDAIASVESANPDFMQAAIHVFDPAVLPKEFSSSDVAEALMKMDVPAPTDWRVMGPLMLRAKSNGVIEETGNLAVRRSIKGHTSNHSQPTYRLSDPLFWIPPKNLRKKWRNLLNGEL